MHIKGWLKTILPLFLTRLLRKIPNTYDQQNIVIVKRLCWAGHLVRMSDDTTVKKLLLGKPQGKIKAGRSKLICLERAENSLKSMGVSRDGGINQEIDLHGLLF
jgi:hypothetical protein